MKVHHAVVLLNLLYPPRFWAVSLPSPTITSLPFTLWNTTNSHCEKNDGSPIDLPDTPARAFIDESGSTVIVTVDTTGRLSRGSSLLNTTRNCTIVNNATSNPNPAMYESNEFLDATWSFNNGTVVAILHDEYPGNTYKNCSVVPYRWPCCWSVSLSLAISQDWGKTWSHASPPPSNLVAAVPYPYESSSTIFGWGDTGGIVRGPDGYFYLTAYNRMTKGLQENGTCVMRTSSLLDPSSWRGWDGKDFTITFVSAYTLPPGDESKHICTVLDPEIFPPPCVMYGVTYSVYLNLFVGTINCNAIALPLPMNRTLYYSTSPDMITWAPMQVLLEPDVLPHTGFISYPSLLDASAPTRGDSTFGTIGQNATLFYVRNTQNFFTWGRQLIGINVSWL